MIGPKLCFGKRSGIDADGRYSKKRLDRASTVEEMKPKNCSGGHLTRTQKAADPSEESMQNHPAWIVKCKCRIFELLGGMHSTRF